VANGDLAVPNPSHIYKKSGVYTISHYIENKGLCYSYDAMNIGLGFRMRVFLDSVICPGSSVRLVESMSYGSGSTFYWRKPDRKLAGNEAFRWDFDDGRGYSTDTLHPILFSPKPGFTELI